MIWFLLFVAAAILLAVIARKFTPVEWVSHARLLFKAWSVWLTSIGTVIGVWLASAPDNLVAIWSMLPPDIKQSLPVNFAQYISYALIALGVVSQFIRQKNLKREADNVRNNP